MTNRISIMKVSEKVTQRVENLKHSSFLKHTLTLGSGVIIAQVIPIITSPVLTRLYSPECFGTLAVFMAIVSSIAPVVCGKYEVAMVLPKSDQDGMDLFVIALWMTFGLSLIFFISLLFFSDRVVLVLNAQKLDDWIFLTPVALLLTGILTAMNYLANRRQDYGKMARVRLIQAVSIAGISVLLGLVGFDFSGMILGSMAGIVAGLIYMTSSYKPVFQRAIFRWSESKTRLMMLYKDYPIYNASSSLLNGITLSLPLFFLTHYFPESIVGYFALVLRVGRTPFSFISTSVSQINLRKIVELVNTQHAVFPYLVKVTLVLILIVIFPTVLLVKFAPSIFAVVFGKEWTEAGFYMQILMPAISVKFIVSTLSTTLDATKNNEFGMIWKVTGFLVTASVFAWFSPKKDPYLLFKAVAVMDIILYSFYYVFILWAAKLPKNVID